MCMRTGILIWAMDGSQSCFSIMNHSFAHAGISKFSWLGYNLASADIQEIADFIFWNKILELIFAPISFCFCLSFVRNHIPFIKAWWGSSLVAFHMFGSFEPCAAKLEAPGMRFSSSKSWVSLVFLYLCLCILHVEISKLILMWLLN